MQHVCTLIYSRQAKHNGIFHRMVAAAAATDSMDPIFTLRIFTTPKVQGYAECEIFYCPCFGFVLYVLKSFQQLYKRARSVDSGIWFSASLGSLLSGWFTPPPPPLPVFSSLLSLSLFVQPFFIIQTFFFIFIVLFSATFRAKPMPPFPSCKGENAVIFYVWV